MTFYGCLQRFFPVGIDVNRILQKDLEIGGYFIPEGVSKFDKTNVKLYYPIILYLTNRPKLV